MGLSVMGFWLFLGKMKYRNCTTTKDIIGFDLFINWDEPIILCEGVFDAMAFKRNAIPLFGKTVMNKLQKKIIEKKVKTIWYINSIKYTQILHDFFFKFLFAQAIFLEGSGPLSM